MRNFTNDFHKRSFRAGLTNLELEFGIRMERKSEVRRGVFLLFVLSFEMLLSPLFCATASSTCSRAERSGAPRTGAVILILYSNSVFLLLLDSG